MMKRTLGIGSLALWAALVIGPAPSATAAEMKILTDEQIENKLFAKSKAISPVRRRAIDMPAVTFEYNSSVLTKAARRQLSVLGRVLSKPAFRGNKFVIGGHTDARGGEAYNKRLSQRRAKAVVEFLASNYGIAKKVLTPVGYGESRLLPNLSPSADNQRRAEIVNLGKGK